MSIKVVYDEQIFLLQEVGGISRYFVELANQFHLHPELGVEPILLVNRSRNKHLRDKLGWAGVAEGKFFFGALALLALAPLRLRFSNSDADILHLTYYTPGFLRRFRNLPRAVTLFDMIPENTPKRGLWNPHFAKRQFLRKSDCVLSISDTSTADMRRQYGFRFPVTTTYLGVSPEFAPGLQRVSWAPDEYILFVGKRDGYKNWKIAANAFSIISRKHPHLFFLLVGGGSLKREEENLLKRLGVSDRVIQHNVAEADLPRVYSNARALLYPSKYEGFGLPLVESMASGTPVVAAEIPINREICERAAFYFDSDSVDEFAKSLGRALEDDLAREAIAKSGIEQSKRYTWYNCAADTANAYKSLMQQKGFEFDGS